MSVDANELQRATLERKKSDELNVIATALGVKPGSRVKKADLVDLILQAAGVTGSRRANVAPAETAVAETAVAEAAVVSVPVALGVSSESCSRGFGRCTVMRTSLKSCVAFTRSFERSSSRPSSTRPG